MDVSTGLSTFGGKTWRSNEAWATYVYTAYLYMLERHSFVHILVFRELLVWPLRKLLVCPPYWTFLHYKNSFIRLFCAEFWCKLVFFVSCLSQISHVFFDCLLFSDFPKPLFQKRAFEIKIKSANQKHYKNSFF